MGRFKEVIGKQYPDRCPVIYHTTVQEINQNTGECTLKRKSGGDTLVIPLNRMGRIINTEGAKSTTNGLLGIAREERLSKIPALSVIFADDRPAVTDLSSFFAYTGRTWVQWALLIYYYAIFFFKLLFQRESLPAALALKTPEQTYVGSVLASQWDETLKELAQLESLIALTLEEEARRNDLRHFKTHWAYLSVCMANWSAFVSKYYDGDPQQLEVVPFFPILESHVAFLGSDRANVVHETFGSTDYFVCGDALVTVDPSTGQGATKAIETAETHFRGVIQGTLDLSQYKEFTNRVVKGMVNRSISYRNLYRP